MAHTLSTAKRMRQNKKRRESNRAMRSSVRTFEKRVASAIQGGKADDAKKALGEACQLIDKAAKQGVMHRNAAARKKSRLAIQVNGISKKK